jgi:cold shock CspA family protein
MISGSVKYFNETKRFGFFRCDDASLPDCFFHASDFESDIIPVVGEKVEFELGTSAKGPRAINVRFVD